MPSDLEDALASSAEDYAVRRRLHDVPPHAVYEVTVDGTRAVCKLARGPEADPATEGRVVEFVGRETTVPVPEVLAVGDDFFLTAWCAAAPSSGTRQENDDAATVDAETARALGEGLATLHAETPFERTGIPRAAGDGVRIEEHETWGATLLDVLEGWRAYLAGVGYDDVAAEVIEFVRGHRELFADAGEPALTHGWYTPEHVGIDDGAVSCVLDWEHALVAPGEYDFCRTEIAVFENPTREAVADEAFRAGYESVRTLPDGFDLRRRAYRAVTFVYFLVSGYVQRQRPADALAEQNEWLTAEISETLASLREER